LECPIRAPEHRMQDKIRKKQHGITYTPTALADFLAAKALEVANKSKKLKVGKKNFHVLDPACGEGELLWAVKRQVEGNDEIRFNAYAVDLDEEAIAKTKKTITKLCFDVEPKVFVANALAPEGKLSLRKGWGELLKKIKAPSGFDLIVANPPWGADMGDYKDRLSTKDFELYSGQCDSSDLFLELGILLLNKGGIMAYIIPDSLFSLERSGLRKFLLSNTQIHFIARLGEKYFDGVNRACAIIVLEKKEPDLDFKIECVHLTHLQKKKVLSGEVSLLDISAAMSTQVAQRRFIDNKNYQLDIDVREEDLSTFKKIQNFPTSFKSYLNSTRGVELSKHGNVSRCPACKMWMPTPIKEGQIKCSNCGQKIDREKLIKKKIVHDSFGKNRVQLIVGENLRRYEIEAKLWIDRHVNGINYKSEEFYSGPKILIRKTGVGISANIDYTDSYVNQVVYIFKTKDNEIKEVPLEIFLAIINSRAMYYYVVKNHGETEWRSHPYLTQTQILDFPIPNMHEIYSEFTKEIKQLAMKIRREMKAVGGISRKTDIEIEKFVAQIYNLKKRDYEAIYKTFNSIEDLLPVRVLKKISPRDLF